MSIQNAYNSWASIYDSNKNKTRDLDKKVTIEVLNNYSFKSVLELGCGTGKNTEWLTKRATKIIGLDFSNEMLEKARAKISNDKVHFQTADLNDKWIVENENFDLITSSLTLEHIENLNHIFNQANLKLLKNGLFYICELHSFKQYIGSKARFEAKEGTIELEVFTHHISDYLKAANQNNFKLLELKEWFDDDLGDKPPRLISFVFKKVES